MASRLWLLLLLVEVTLSAVAGLLLAAILGASREAGFVVGAVLCVAIPVLLTAASVLGASAAAAPLSPLLRAACSEPLHFALAVGRIIAEPWRHSPDTAPPTTGPARPVLLLHGIVCNRGIWRSWVRELEAAGFRPVRALNLEPLFADIDVHAAHVARELRALQQASDGAAVNVITHSMGGLVARAALPLVCNRTIRQIITLACPHHGTRWARCCPSAPVRQMRRDSAWLAALNCAQEHHWSVPVTSIGGCRDNLVVPPDSAVLGGAACHLLDGHGHFGLLGSRAARERAFAALAAP